ncbi:MAG: RsmE family RNA methyltransferase [Flavobacteriaceae bacterium]
MLLFYDSQIKIETQNHLFNRSDSKHLIKVLRKKQGSEIKITDGKGIEWTGIVTFLNQQKVLVEKIDAIKHKLPKKLIHLAIAPTKSNERMEWLVEKLTELGIASITPIICTHSERKVIKIERLTKIAISALKQSNQFFLPEIKPVISFKNYIQALKNKAIIAHCHPTQKINLSKYIIPENEISLCVGPEGDFSTEEIKLATLSGITPVSLGKQRFRTETAGIFGCHSISVNYQKI